MHRVSPQGLPVVTNMATPYAIIGAPTGLLRQRCHYAPFKCDLSRSRAVRSPISCTAVYEDSLQREWPCVALRSQDGLTGRRQPLSHADSYPKRLVSTKASRPSAQRLDPPGRGDDSPSTSGAGSQGSAVVIASPCLDYIFI